MQSSEREESSESSSDDDYDERPAAEQMFLAHKIGPEYPLRLIYRSIVMWEAVLIILQNPPKLARIEDLSKLLLEKYQPTISSTLSVLAVTATASVVPDRIQGTELLLPEGSGPRLNPKKVIPLQYLLPSSSVWIWSVLLIITQRLNLSSIIWDAFPLAPRLSSQSCAHIIHPILSRSKIVIAVFASHDLLRKPYQSSVRFLLTP